MLDFNQNPEEICNYIVEEGGERVDAYLTRVTGKSRNLIIQILEGGAATVNGRPVKKSYKVSVGDIIYIEFPPEQVPDISPKEVDFEVLLDRPEFAVINKPAGLVVHPAVGHMDETLVNGLMHRFGIEDDDNGFRPGIVHRLDKDTSGVMVIAKTRDAREKLSALFQTRAVEKRYLAVCMGKPKFKTLLIEEPIARHPKDRKKMSVVIEGGKHASSEVSVKQRYENAFLAEVKINTGRTHQIRVHMAHKGFPLLGDEVYGGKTVMGKGIERQALHAFHLRFESPFGNETVDCKVNVPEDMLKLINKLRKNSIDIPPIS